MKEFKFIREYVTECAIEETIVAQAKTKEEALEKIRNSVEIPNMNEDPELYIDFIKVKSLCDDPINTEILNIREIKENKE